jgi:hypothetical protein
MDKLSGKDKYFINFAHNGFYQNQLYALDKAREFGFKTIGYRYDDIDSDFKEKNKNILSQHRGAGYWIWKPYFIYETLKKVNDGDYLVYMDSGAFFCKSPDDILRMINHKGVLAFSMSIHKQSTWCKKDCFKFVFNDNEDYHDYSQIHASFIFIQKCKSSMDFIEKWLNLCQNEKLVTDSQSILPNYPDFKEHRHDQALYSLLVYRENIMYIPDITQWCFEFGYDVDSRKIVEHHRNKN